MFNEQIIKLDKINKVGSGRVYTEGEFSTGGTWIDDAPVYSKVISRTDITRANTYTISHGISNLGMILSYSGIIKSKDKSFQCSMENAEIIATGSFFISGDNIVFETLDSIGGGPFDVTLILEYTKETV